MLHAYKYLLRPNAEQVAKLDFLLWQSRLIYNAALEQRITTYQETGKGVNYGAQWTYFRDLRHDCPDTLGQLNASSVQHMLRRLDKSFTAFFRRVRIGEKPGFPRFKGRNRFHSVEYTYGDGCKLRQNEHGRKSFYVQNVGEMRMCFHRPLPEGATIKHVVVKRVGERWYALLMLDLPDPNKRQMPTGNQVGVDVGLKSLAALSTGELIANPAGCEKVLLNCGDCSVTHPARSKGVVGRRKRISRLPDCTNRYPTRETTTCTRLVVGWWMKTT